jgi:transglutaminase-like putative cysteine protease
MIEWAGFGARKIPMRGSMLTTQTLTVRVGCEFRYQLPAAVPAIFLVRPMGALDTRILRESWITTPLDPYHDYTDIYGNVCRRVTLPAGYWTLNYEALAVVDGAPDPVGSDAMLHLVEELPDDVLVYTLPSRFCLSDELSSEAWSLFGQTTPGWERVQSICDYVHDHINFGYGWSLPTTTSTDVYHAGRGVCRDRVLPRDEHPRTVRFWIHSGHRRTADGRADGFLRVDGGVHRRALVDVRSAQQRAPPRPRADRARTRCTRRRDGYHLRHGISPGHDGHSGRNTAMSPPGPEVAIDHAAVDWSGVIAARYRVEQTLRYEYEAPIHDLRHRLIVAPRRRHLDQERVEHSVWSSADGPLTLAADAFGNDVASVWVPRVEREITFGLESSIVRDRRLSAGAARVDANDPRWLDVGRLTRADDALLDAAADLRARNPDPRSCAHAIVRFVHGQLAYTKGVTDVFTTASTAFRMRRGVCQDFSHITIAIARACGIAARYASGHLLGEGATHAWVEFLIERDGATDVLSLDPTHRSETDFRYIVVAIGRDYEDVPPTSGVFSGKSAGKLHGRQRVVLTHVTYAG